MWLGSQHLLSRLDIVHVLILSSCIQVQETAHDLGVVIDSRLSLGEHVASVSCSGYYQLRQLRPVVRCLSDNATKTEPLSCCFWHHKLFCRMQSVQNSAARLVTGAKRSDHFSPVLCQLHWLPVRQCVVFKIVTLVHQYLSGHAPGYLADDCQLVTDDRRSSKATAFR